MSRFSCQMLAVCNQPCALAMCPCLCVGVPSRAVLVRDATLRTLAGSVNPVTSKFVLEPVIAYVLLPWVVAPSNRPNVSHRVSATLTVIVVALRYRVPSTLIIIVPATLTVIVVALRYRCCYHPGSALVPRPCRRRPLFPCAAR